MTMCIDVLYHILGEEQDYMRATVDKLFEKADKLIVIYAQDSCNPPENFGRGAHLYNSEWRQYLESKYDAGINLVYQQKECMPRSGAKFFVYEKVNNGERT